VGYNLPSVITYIGPKEEAMQSEGVKECQEKIEQLIKTGDELRELEETYLASRKYSEALQMIRNCGSYELSVRFSTILASRMNSLVDIVPN